jgi:xylulokinase
MDWSAELLEAMGIDESRLPPLHPPSQIVGEVTNAAAAQTGLAKGTPVIAGMVDATAAALEAGAIQAGEAVEMTGQSTVLMICSDQPYLGRNLIPLGHAIAGKHLTVGAMVATGGSLRWFRDQLGETERRAAEMIGADAFELLSLEAGKSAAGANRLIFLPYMYGERSPIWDSHARGVFAGLSLATTRADLIRAIMEGAAYGLRHNVETAEEDGFYTTRLACVGGGSKSAVWNQIKADVLNKPLLIPKAAVGAPLGDAMLAAVAAGLFSSVEQALHQFVQPGISYQPDAAQVKRYEQYYRIYLSLYPALQGAFRELGKIDETATISRRDQGSSKAGDWRQA